MLSHMRGSRIFFKSSIDSLADHLLEILIVLTFWPSFIEDVLLYFIQLCHVCHEASHMCHEATYLVPLSWWSSLWKNYTSLLLELKHEHMTWFFQESVKGSNECHFWTEALMVKSKFTIQSFPSAIKTADVSDRGYLVSRGHSVMKWSFLWSQMNI